MEFASGREERLFSCFIPPPHPSSFSTFVLHACALLTSYLSNNIWRVTLAMASEHFLGQYLTIDQQKSSNYAKLYMLYCP
mmetsp:Transcript_13599/g.22602  ORF Transcript_13599/g.22602 Transcript_13599/m.22602 type:complete len:80 (-) Transcript_13599:62-301(-)